MAVMDYRTRDGLADYGFSIEPEPNDGWRVYIAFHPFCKGDNTPNLPYEATDNNGRLYVDWPGKIDSLGDAKTVAGLWAELVEPYRCAQEQRAFYVELIDHYLRTQEQRMATLAGQDSLTDAINNGRSDHEQCDREPRISRAETPESISNLKKSQRSDQIPRVAAT